MVVARARGVAALALLTALLAVTSGCTSSDDGDAEPAAMVPTPEDEGSTSPTPAGLRVAVLLPDDASADAAVRNQIAADVRRLDATRGPEIAEVTPIRPQAEAFVADLAWTLAERETDLICLVGRSQRSLLKELATLNPHLAFCGAPLATTADVPDTVQPLAVRSEELGHVVGLAAASAASDARIGVVLGVQAQHRAFRDGLLAAVAGHDTIVVAVDDGLDALTAVEQVLAEDVEVVVIGDVPGAGDAVSIAAEQALVLSPDALLRGIDPERSVLHWRVDWEVILRRALDRLTGEADAAAVSFGFADGVFTVSTGDAASAAVRARVDRAVTALVAGEIDPLEPPADVVREERGPPIPAPPDVDSDDDPDGEPDGDPDGGTDGDAAAGAGSGDDGG